MKQVLVVIILSLISGQEIQEPDRAYFIHLPQRVQDDLRSDQQQAVEAAEKNVKANPSSADAHLNLADVYFRYFGPGRTHDARIFAEYQEAIKLNPMYAAAYCGLAGYYGLQSDRKRQIEALNTAVALKPDYADAYCKLGFAHLDEESHNGVKIHVTEQELLRAVDAFKRAIQVKPDLTDAYDGLGSATYSLGLYRDSLAAFSRAVFLTPNDIVAHLGVGRVYIQLGNKKGAMQEYEALIRIATQLAEKRSGGMQGNSLNPASDWAAYLLKKIQERFGN